MTKSTVDVTDDEGILVYDQDGDLRVGITADFKGPDGVPYNGETQLVVRGKASAGWSGGSHPPSDTHREDDVFVFSSHWAALWLGRRGGGQAGDLIIRGHDATDSIRLDGKKGDILLYDGADLAEEFPVAVLAEAAPRAGAVIIVDSESGVMECVEEYDRRVVGVVSGAGGLKPGIVLDKRAKSKDRVPIALAGKAYCLADATFGSIAVGDLLVSSSSPGYGMKCQDPLRGFGCVVGKALEALREGKREILVLVGCR